MQFVVFEFVLLPLQPLVDVEAGYDVEGDLLEVILAWIHERIYFVPVLLVLLFLGDDALVFVWRLGWRVLSMNCLASFTLSRVSLENIKFYIMIALITIKI